MINIGSGHGLLPDHTKSYPKPFHNLICNGSCAGVMWQYTYIRNHMSKMTNTFPDLQPMNWFDEIGFYFNGNYTCHDVVYMYTCFMVCLTCRRIWGWLIGEWRKTQVFKSNSPPTHLVCNAHLIANFLSFHMTLVVVMDCDAGSALHGFEINMLYFFLKVYLIPISKIYCCSGRKMPYNNANDTFPESWFVKDYKNVKLVNLLSCKTAQLLLMLCMISRNSDFLHNVLTKSNFILMDTENTTLN